MSPDRKPSFPTLSASDVGVAKAQFVDIDQAVKGKIEGQWRSIGLRGKNELEALSPSVHGRTLFPGSKEFRVLPEDVQLEARKSIARVVFSISMHAIDVLLREGKFDQKQYFGWYNFMIAGTNVPPVAVESKPVVVDPEKLNKLRERHNRDKTNATFFTQKGIYDLPEELRKILQRFDASLFLIREEILPNEYKKPLAEEGIGRSHRAIVERRVRKRKEEGRPIVIADGDPDLTRYTGKKVKAEKPDSTQLPYDVYDFDRIVVEALKKDQEKFIESQVKLAKERRKEKKPIYRINPSGVAICRRREGYRLLGYRGAGSSVESMLARIGGTGLHYGLERVLKSVLRDVIDTEVHTEFADPDIRGSIDILFLNREVNEVQAIDIKTVSSRRFAEITRNGVLPYLADNSKWFKENDPDRRQLLTYMYNKRKAGINVTMGLVWYVEEGVWARKQALIPWADYEGEALTLATQITEARQQIEKRKLPAPDVGPYCKWCPWLKHCEPGQEHLMNTEGEISLPREVRMSKIAMRLANKGREEKEKRLAEIARVQTSLSLPTASS